MAKYIVACLLKKCPYRVGQLWVLCFYVSSTREYKSVEDFIRYVFNITLSLESILALHIWSEKRKLILFTWQK